MVELCYVVKKKCVNIECERSTSTASYALIRYAKRVHTFKVILWSTSTWPCCLTTFLLCQVRRPADESKVLPSTLHEASSELKYNEKLWKKKGFLVLKPRYYYNSHRELLSSSLVWETHILMETFNTTREPNSFNGSYTTPRNH